MTDDQKVCVCRGMGLLFVYGEADADECLNGSLCAREWYQGSNDDVMSENQLRDLPNPTCL